MRIIVCIKQVPASNKVDVDPVTGVMKRDGAESKMNPYDLFALECALRLRREYGGSVSVITMGPPQAEKVLREAFSMGADEGFLLSDRRFAGADVLATSYTIAQGISKLGGFDIIICGKQTTDGDTAQVGAELGERLGIPAVANVSEIVSADEGYIIVRTDNGETVQTAKITSPCLLCVEKDICTPRLPSYLQAKATADRKICVFSLDDLDDANPKNYGLSGSPTQVRRVFPPEPKKGGIRIEGGNAASELFEKLCEKKFI